MVKAPEPGSSGRSWGSVVVAGAVAVAAAVAVIGAFAAGAAVLGEPFSVFSKEPAETFPGMRYAGSFANLVSVVWLTGAVAAVVGGTALCRSGRAATGRFLLVGGLLVGVLVADDLFLLHESVYPKIGIPEEAVYLAYGVGTAAFGWFYRRHLGRELLLLVAAVGFWVVSVASDVVQEMGWGQSYIVEDGSKAVGVVLWTVMLVRLTLAALTDAMRPAVGPLAEPSPGGATPGARHRSER